MAISVLGGQNSSAPIGSTSLVTQGVSSVGLATYTPSAALPAGTYTLTASGATDGVSATVNNVEKTSSKGNAVTFTASVPITSLEMKSTATPDFSNLGKTVDLPASSNQPSEFRVLGEVNGTYYGYNAGTYTTLYWSTDLYRYSSMSVPTFSGGTAYTGETIPRFFKDPSGNYVVIGQSYTIKSTNNGSTWTQYTNGLGGNYPISYNGSSIFVTSNGTNFLSSTDGITWTTRTAASYSFSVIEWLNNQFVAATAAAVYTSPDGVTWTQKTTTAGMATTPSSIAYGSTGVYVFGNLSNVNIYSSSTLTGAFSVSSGVSGAVTYMGNQFYVFAYTAGTYYTSTNGFSWPSYSMPNGFSQSVTWLAHNAANTEAIITYGTNGLFRVNGSYSIPQFAGGAGSGSIVAYVKVGNTQYIYDSVSNIWITSDNGATWINRSWKPNAAISAYSLLGVAYNGSIFYGIWGYPGSSNLLYYGSSPDGYTWTINTGTPVYSASSTIGAGSVQYTSDNNNIYIAYVSSSYNITKISAAGTALGSWSQTITNATAGQPYNYINPQIMNNSIVAGYFNSSASFAVVNLSTMTGLLVQTAGGTITLNSAYSMGYAGNVWIAIGNGGAVYTGVYPDKLSTQNVYLGPGQGTSYIFYGVYNNEFYVSQVSSATNNSIATLLKSGNGTEWVSVGTYPNTAALLAGYNYSGYSVRWRFPSNQYQVQYANVNTPTVFSLYATPVATYN